MPLNRRFVAWLKTVPILNNYSQYQVATGVSRLQAERFLPTTKAGLSRSINRILQRLEKDRSERERYNTLVNELHFIKYYAQFLNVPTTKIEGKIVAITSPGKHFKQAQQVLALIDFEQNICFRNRIVNALVAQMPQIQNVMLQYARYGSHPKFGYSQAELLRFGLTLRTWLEVAMRFTNVPMDTGSITYLYLVDDLDESEQQFSHKALANQTFLVLIKKQYHRVFYRLSTKDVDKYDVKPKRLVVPLGETISGILHFYIRFCRPPKASVKEPFELVFRGERGGYWSRVVEHSVKYLKRIGIDILSYVGIQHNYSFESKNIAMSVFAYQVSGSGWIDYDMVREWTRLAKQYFAEINVYYNSWQVLFNSFEAFTDYIHIMQQEPLFKLRNHEIKPKNLSQLGRLEVPLYQFLQEDMYRIQYGQVAKIRVFRKNGANVS